MFFCGNNNLLSNGFPHSHSRKTYNYLEETSDDEPTNYNPNSETEMDRIKYPCHLG